MEHIQKFEKYSKTNEGIAPDVDSNMSGNIYIANVTIAVVAENEFAAQDAISMALSENLVERDAILDWKYNDIEDKVENIGKYQKGKYSEGQVFTKKRIFN